MFWVVTPTSNSLLVENKLNTSPLEKETEWTSHKGVLVFNRAYQRLL
jgi:hypothetical protein